MPYCLLSFTQAERGQYQVGIQAATIGTGRCLPPLNLRKTLSLDLGEGVFHTDLFQFKK